MMRRLLLLSVIATLAWLAGGRPLAAHGGGTPRLTNAPAGPYRVYAWSDPEPWRVGEVHLSLAVTEPATAADDRPGAQLEIPVTAADITVLLTPVDGGAPIRLVAERQPFLNNFYFEVDTQLPAAGLWDVTIQVDGPAGSGSTGFRLEAQPPLTLHWGYLAAGAGTLVAVAALAGMTSRRGPAPRRPRRSAATQPASVSAVGGHTPQESISR